MQATDNDTITGMGKSYGLVHQAGDIGIRNEVAAAGGNLLPIACSSRAACGRFLLAHKRTVLCTCIPSLALVVPNHRRKIQPNDDVGRTVLVGLGLAGELLQREGWERQRDSQ